MKMEMLPSTAVLPTLINNVGDSSNVYDSASLLDSCGNSSVVMYFPLQAPPFALLLSCLILSLSLGLTFFCPFR